MGTESQKIPCPKILGLGLSGDSVPECALMERTWAATSLSNPFLSRLIKASQSLTTPGCHVETTCGAKMTSQKVLMPNNVELEGVATVYRRVYLNIAFPPRKTVFSTDQRGPKLL